MELFRKHNNSRFPDSLHREAEGLALLSKALDNLDCPRVGVPHVISVTDDELVLPAIASAPPAPELMAALGDGLARIHQQPHPRYGLANDNYIGLSPQQNGWSDDWGSFFLKNRLGVQVGMIREQPVREEFQHVLDRKGAALVDFLNRNCDQPSLLHGDLWSGNAVFDRHKAWLIDPAVYYGDREADLAMTEFFGGFTPEFYQAYDKVWPRTPEYSLKRDIYNLYHALNHYNLFGSGYLGKCRGLFGALSTL
jgi:fructosamine-3-kinase